MADLKTRSGLVDHSRLFDLKYGSEIVVEVLDVDGKPRFELDVLGWLSCDALATWIVVADPLELEVGVHQVRARMLNSPKFKQWPSRTIIAPLDRDGLSEAYAYEGRLGHFRPHEIPNYCDG
jgi:hypothetical protein